MAPGFLQGLRRRSKSYYSTHANSIGTTNGTPNERGSKTSSGTSTGDDVTTTQSSSTTLNSTNTQPMLSNVPSFSAGPQAIQPQARPPLSTSASNRYSVSGMSGLGSANGLNLPVSQYAPKVLNITDGAWVNQKVLLLFGCIGQATDTTIHGYINIASLEDSFPLISWPVSSSYFKALVYLSPGRNRLRIDFSSPKLVNSNNSNSIHASYLTIHMLPNLSNPPLQLAILLGKDSPATFDALPSHVENGSNGLDIAISKFRMAAGLWQAFTSENMNRNRLGRRVFRFEEEFIPGTSSSRDRELGTMRSEARVHVIRSHLTVAELRDTNIAQQNEATKSGDLFSIAADAVQKHFHLAPGQKQYVAVLILDSHWDGKLITGHAALGGSAGDTGLAVFGSHALHAYPSCLEEIVSAFSDCTITDTNHVANDCEESGSNWEAATIGIGAHLHEVGHLFGNPHRENGIMLRDFVRFNRSFLTRESFSTRTKSKGEIVLREDECLWHRLDCLRFRSHPCFARPGDPPRQNDDLVCAWPIESGVIFTAVSGVGWLEIYTEEDDLCHHWIEFGDGNSTGPIQRQITMAEQEVRNALPEEKRKLKMKVLVNSWSGGTHEIKDLTVLASKISKTKLSNGQMAFRGPKLGQSSMNGSQPEEVIFSSTIQQTKLMTHVRVYHGLALDGLEFVYEDGTTQMFGKKGGQPGGSEFSLDIRRGEYITCFQVRAGFWIDGLSINTSLGRKSPFYGNANGPSP